MPFNNDQLQDQQTPFIDTPNIDTPPQIPGGVPSFDENGNPLGGGNKPTPKNISSNPDNIAERALTKALKGDSFAQGSFLNPKVVPYGDTRKYMDMPYGYTYGLDNEDIYAQDEGVWKNMGKGLARLGVSTGVKLGQGVGFLLGLANPVNWNSDLISNAADNGISAVFNQLDDKTKNDWLPTFQEAADRNKGFFSRAFTDLDFWTSDVVDGLAFMASAWVPGLGLSKLGLGMKVAQGLSGLRLGADAAEAGVEAAGMAQNYLTKAGTLAKNLDKFTAWGLATGSEAMFEASQTKDDIYKSLSYDDYGRPILKPGTNHPYTEQEKKEIAAGGAQNTFLLNTALLGLTNSIELKWLGNIIGKPESEAAVKGISGAMGLADQMVAKEAGTDALSKFLNSKTAQFLKGAAEGTIAEGFIEENAQNAIQRVNDKYGAKGKVASLKNIGEFLSQYVDQTIAAVQGKDAENADNIGIGAILGIFGGGASAIREHAKEEAHTSHVIAAYNQAQENWLKFGNIYKTEDVVSKDSEGKDVVTKKMVLDQNGKPVIDADKLTASLAGYQSVNSALDASTKTNDSFKRDVLRDTAFADYVQAHINAGIENTIFDKLDGVRKSNPADLAKMGFVVGDDLGQQIDRYKNLAAAIIKQNKLINSDILFDESAEDQARKTYMTNLAAQQAVYKNLMNETAGKVVDIRNQLVNSDNSALSDGMVDQLNEISQRIKSQQEVIQNLADNHAGPTQMKVAQQVLDELNDKKAQLLKDNKTTIEGLKEKDGKYIYEKGERNVPGISDQYDKHTKLKGELENHVRSLGYEWAQYADTKNGKKNFTDFFKSDIVDPLMKSMNEEALNNIPEGKTLTVSGINEKGQKVNYELQEGKEYIGKLTQSERYRGNKTVKTFNNDRIKIVKLSDDGKTVTVSVNGDAAFDVDSEELGNIAVSEKWVDYNKLTDDQKLYMNLRNHEILYRVIKRDATGKQVVGPDGRFQFITAKGRVTLDQSKQNLLFKWVDPASGKVFSTDFNNDFVQNKESLEKYLTKEQASLQRQQNKIKKKFQSQQQYLYNLINETEQKLTSTEARRQANEEEFDRLDKELSDLKSRLENAVKYLQQNPYLRGRKSNQYKEMEELSKDLPTQIAQKENQLQALTTEKEEISSLLDTLKQTREQYYQGLFEMEDTNQPFNGQEVEQTQQDLVDASANQVTRRFTPEQLNKMIGDTEAELDLVNERVDFLQKHIDNLKKLLKNILAYKDVADALMDISDREQLRNQLKMIEDQSSDSPEKAKLVNAIRKGLAKGDKGIETQYTLELMNRYKNALNELEDLSAKQQELSPKLIRLQAAEQQNSNISSIQNRLNFLTTVKNGLIAQHEIAKKEQLKVRQAQAAETIQKDLLGNKLAQWEVTDEGGLYDYDTRRPLLANNGLFNTTGLHFTDKEDTQLNMENNNAQFFKFSADANLAVDDYYLIPVTKDNDHFGIRREDKYADDIKLVVVKKVGDQYKYVDQNGEVQENPTKESLIYTTMHGNATLLGDNLQAAVDEVNKKFTTKGLTQSEVVDQINKFKAFRDKIKSRIKEGQQVLLPVTGKTKGVQVQLPLTVDGLPQEHGVEGRLIKEDSEDFKSLQHPDGQPITLSISTSENTKAGVKPGRAVMSRTDGTDFRVYNRKMSDEEKNNFVNLLKVLTGLYSRKNSIDNPLSKQEALDLNDITTYLNGLVFWTDDSNTNASPRKFFINTKDGMLYKGAKGYAFTPEAIEAAREELTGDLYHQVNDKLLKQLDTPFYQVVAKDGKLKKNEYQNYTHYVLGQRDNQGNPRELGTPAVYTNVPVYTKDELTPQLKSVNLNFQDPDEPLRPKIILKQGEDTHFAGIPATDATQDGYIATAATGFRLPKFVVDAKPTAEQVSQPATVPAPQFVMQGQPAPAMSFRIPANEVQQQQTQTQVPQAPQMTEPVANPFVIPAGQVKAPPAPIMQNKPGEPDILSKILSSDYQKNIPEGTSFPENDKIDNIYREALGNVQKKENFQKVQNFFTKRLPGIPVFKLAQMIDGMAWGAFKNGAVYIFENAEEGTGYHEAFEAVWNAYLTSPEQEELAKAFRSQEGTFTNPFSKETKPYSEASMYDVREMLAEGFRSHILELENKTFGQKILDFFKELWDNIKSFMGLTNQEKGELDQLINDTYTDIYKGKYRNAQQVRSVDSMGTTYRQAIPETTQEFTTQVTEGLTGFFFMNLYKNQKNMDSLVDKAADNNKLLKDLFSQSMEDLKDYLIRGKESVFHQQYVAPYEKQLGRELTLEEKDHLFRNVYMVQDRNAHMIPNIFQYPKDVYENLKASLKKYGLQFRETSNNEDEEFVSNKEENVTNTLGIRDTIFIDPRRLTAVNFRMLIGSLTDDTYDSSRASKNNTQGIIFKKNNLGLPKLVDFDRVHNLLINELNSSVSKIEDGKFIDALTVMMNRLDEKYKMSNGQYRDGYAWINRLKGRLKYAGHGENYFTTQNLTKDDIKMLVGFEKSLMNKQNMPVKTIVGEDGYIYDTNPIETSNQVKIRERWENAVARTVDPLGKKNPNSLLGVADNGQIVIDRNSHPFKGFPDTTKAFLSMLKPNFGHVLENLAHLGINFSASQEELKPYNLEIFDAYDRIRSKIMDGTIQTMSDLYGNNIVSSSINKLIGIESKLVSEDNVLMHLTADGQPQYSITLPSNIGYTTASLNSAKNLRDFVMSNPQVGYVDGAGNVVLHPYQSRSLLLKPGGLLFDNNGKRRAGTDVLYHLISGMANNESDGTNTADLAYPDRVMQEIHYLLKNIHFTIINSDKSTEFGLGLKAPFVTYRQASADINSPDFDPVMNIYRDQLEDEIDSAIREQQKPSGIANYSKQVKQLGHYREILGEDLIKEFTKKVLTGKMTKQDFMNKPQVDQAIRKHITGLVKETIDGLVDLDIIKRTQEGYDQNKKPVYNYSTTAISHEALSKFGLDGSNMNQAEIESLVGFLALNKEIAVTEQHKLTYGHPVMYKDLAKRANGANSTKDAIIDNPQVLKWMDSSMTRLDGKIRSAEQVQTFKNISFKDVTAVSNFYKEIAEGMYASMKEEGNKADIEKRIGAQFDTNGKLKNFILDKGKVTGEMKAYLEANEADAQAWIMPDMWRDMLFLSSKITEDQLRQWEYEKAYEIISRSSKRSTHPAYKEYHKKTIQEARKVLEQGNPGVIMQTLKPQYFGYAQNNDMMQTVFLKHSVQPKFYRHVEGTQYENMYLAAQKNQIDIVGFESGQKVGNMLNDKGEFVPIYNEEGGINTQVEYDEKGNSKGVNLPSDLPIQTLFTRYYGIQQEVPSLGKEKVVRGTQVTKLVQSNFYENGKPVSQKAGELIDEYNQVLTDMIRMGKQNLLDKLGIQQMQDGSYAVKDISKMVDTVREELEKRDLPNNLLDALDIDPSKNGLLYKFDTLANVRKIDNIINAIVDSSVISDKMHGKAAVQVASTGFETNNRKAVYLNDKGVFEEVGDKKLTDEEKKSIRYTSNDLKFYRTENGKISGMEVYFPWFFKGVNPEEMGLKLVNGRYEIPQGMDERLLKAIGFRIPTQGMNSIENIIIKGFLPKEMGDMVVVPTEIVGKAGSDFDIDKLNMYLSNYAVEPDIRNYESEEFKQFMISGLTNYVEDGNWVYTEKQAKALLDFFSPEDLKNINKANYTENGMLEKGGKSNLEEMIPDLTTREHAARIKSLLTDYNSLVKGKKNIIYIEASKDSKEGLQNRFKEIMHELVSLPENYRQLTVPNGSATLESLADEIRELKGEKNTENSFLALRKFIPMAEVRERYLTGKQMVGIAALQTTSHTMFQVAGTKLSGKYDPKMLWYLFNGQRERDIVIRLNHNVNENGELYLYAKRDKDGKWISELHSEALTGFVDAAKNPFVFDLNLSLNSAGTWFYLQKLGVPVKDIAYLFNQPILNDYFKEEAKNKTYFKQANGEQLSRWMLMMKVMNPYMEKISSLKGKFEEVQNKLDLIDKFSDKDFRPELSYRERNSMIIAMRKGIKEIRVDIGNQLEKIRSEKQTLSTDELRSAIKNLNNPSYNMSEEDAKFQLGTLADYLEYNAQASYLSEYIRSIGYDNTRTKSIIENNIQEARWNKMLDSKFIANPEAILEKTFLGEMKRQKEDVKNMFQNFFVSLSTKAQKAFEPLYRKINNREIFQTNDSQAELISRYQNFFLNYLIQTTPFIKNNQEQSLNSKYQELMKGAMSMGKQLKFLREVEDPNISENPIVKELLPILANDATQVDNIKLFRNRMDTYKNNVLIESIENLHNYAIATGNKALVNFVENLSTFVILQSGLQDSSINYSKVLPVSLYTKMVNDILSNYTDGEVDVDPELVWKQFHQNNWKNTSIVPKVKFAKKSKVDDNLMLDASYSDAQNEFITRTTIRKDMMGARNAARRDELIKQKKGNEVFETILYQKVGEEDTGSGIYAIYKPINKLGDRYKFAEVYKDDRDSILPQNNTVNRETGMVQATYIPQAGVSTIDDGSVTRGMQATLDSDGSISFPSSLRIKASDLQQGNNNLQPELSKNKVEEGDIFSIPGIPVITTNLGGVHGAGLAQLAKNKGLITQGDGAYKATDKVVQLPVKKVWSDSMAMNNNIELLKDSLRNLINTARQNPNQTYLLPLAGLGHGEGSVQEILPLLIKTVQAADNIKLVLPGDNINLGRQGTVRKDTTREKMPEIKKMLVEAGLLSSKTTSDIEIASSPEYKTWLAQNANPIMSEQENLDYYKQCILGL